MKTRRKWPIVLGSIAGVLIIAVAVGLFVLDGILTSQARAQAVKLSKQLGRPVKIGSVATKLFSGLAVRVSEVQVGAASGEKLPLARIDRLEVKAALLKALSSKGKDIEITSAEVSGLTVNVIKLDDGKTNLEHLQEKLAEDKPQEESKGEPKPKDDKPTDLSRLRVDHFALLEGHVRFLDETTSKEKQLDIQHLSVVVNDLQSGKPLDVVVKAAVLASKENFELRLHAAPLPASLTPTPERVMIKISPIDLAPLAPFIPSSVGLEEGHLDADFTAELGGAVPGGAGKTKVAGVVHALGLKFAGAEGGKALDAALEANIDADAAAGDVDIKELKLDLGPAGITGSGRASGLRSKNPSVEGLQIVSHDLDPQKLAALYPPLRQQLKGQISGPIGLTVRGAGSQEHQQVELRLDFTPVKLAVPETLAKAAGAKMLMLAHAKGAGATNGELGFDVSLDLSGVDLRPGKLVNKSPGETLLLLLEGSKTGGEKDAPTKVTLSSFVLKILDQAISGNASVELAGKQPHTTTTFAVRAHSSRIDVDKLLIPTKTKQEKPPLDPKTFAGLSGHAEVKIDKLRAQKQEMTNVVAEVTLQEDDLQIKAAHLEAFGGVVDASGTHLKLAHPDQPLHAQVSLKDIEIGQGLAMMSDKKVMGGKFYGEVNFDAKGQDPEILKKTVAGLIQGKIIDGTFLGKDLIASLTGPLASKLPFGLAGRGGKGGATSLGKELPFGIQLENGRANLKSPIKLALPEAAISLGGGLTLEGILDLAGQADLSPQTISTLTQGKAKVDGPIPIKFKLGGPAWKPEITDLDLGGAVQAIVKGAAAGAIGQVLGGEAGKKAGEIIAGGTDKAKEEAQKAAQAQADKARKEAEARARAEAEKQKKKLEDEAANKLKGLFGR